MNTTYTRAEYISEETLMAMADTMAAAAVSFSSHGYDQFIQSREELKKALHSLSIMVRTNEIDAIMGSIPCPPAMLNNQNSLSTNGY